MGSIPPGRSEFMDLINYYQRELDKLRVEIRLNVRVDHDLVDSIEPDTIVLATGSLPEMPQIEGLFVTDMDIHTVVEVLKGEVLIDDLRLLHAEHVRAAEREPVQDPREAGPDGVHVPSGDDHLVLLGSDRAW